MPEPERRQITDRDVELATQLRLAIGRTSRRLRVDGSAGLTSSQVSALVMVEQGRRLRIGDLAAREGVSAPTMTRVVAALESLGHLVRSADPLDARSSFVAVSASGHALLDQLRRDRTAYLAVRVARLSDDDRSRLAAALPVLESLAREDDDRC